MTAAAFSGWQVTTVWLLHQLGRAYASQEGLTPEQAWELSEPRQRAELFNPVATQINPNQVDDAVAKWERLAGRDGACVADTRPAAPWTGPDQPVTGAARPSAAAARSAPGRPVPAGLVPAAQRGTGLSSRVGATPRSHRLRTWPRRGTH
jgi:hypothetical protein